ncbi:MAG TPA: A/G-specific adenine glycosylase [Micropepsaceae bacterium]|nr:A/G-specific adenine glycosylase [Micropepsaceae bacterium]
MGVLNAKDHRRKARAPASAATALLAWYDVHKRELPWRAKAGEVIDPYRVWLSEIMLQQTTVAAVARYYLAFLERWPDVTRLAAASQDEVLGAWAGLGYYSRAHNLHRAARTIAEEHGGSFPASLDGLRRLPGIGAYTAAAIGAIAFGLPAAAMDANAERVIARLFAVEEPLPRAKTKLAALAAPLVPQKRPGDFAQALMDLGSLLCVPKRPLCAACPLAVQCAGRALGIAQNLPRKAAERARPLKRGAAFVALDAEGAVYLVRRPEKGLLGGMLQPPLGEWAEAFPKRAAAIEEAPFVGDWVKKPGFVRHGFTHFELEMEVYVANFHARPNGQGAWYSPNELKGAALPTLMRKVISHALDEGGPLFEFRMSSRSIAANGAKAPGRAGKRVGSFRVQRGRARTG